MRGTFNRAFAVSLLVVFAVCGGKKSPTSPTPNPSPTPSSVAVTSPNAAILVGQTEQMTAIVTLSDGTTRAGTGTWGSDTPSVATVSQSGLATGLAAGEATIYFDATGDGRGSKRLRVDPKLVSLVGAVSALAGGRLPGVSIRILDGPNAGAFMLTNAVGDYRFDGLTPGSANVSASAAGYEEQVKAVSINGTNTLNFILRSTTPWSRSGSGDMVFDMPTYISRVRIVGTYTGYGSNFIVRIAGALVVNEILGTTSIGIGTRYDGTHLTSGGVVAITNSSGVSWSFTEVR